MLSRQVSGVAATDLTPRERGDLIAELQSLATTFDTLAANATGEEMLDTAREARTRVEAALAEPELGSPQAPAAWPLGVAAWRARTDDIEGEEVWRVKRHRKRHRTTVDFRGDVGLGFATAPHS